jgi:transposase
MRRSFDGLACLVREHLGHDPLSGDVFVFVNVRGDRIKLLLWDRGGFWLFYRCLERGRFHLPATLDAATSALEIESGDLGLILEGIDLAGSRRRPRWEPPTA